MAIISSARSAAYVLLAGTLAIGSPVFVQDTVDLFADDFSRFPPGMLSAPIGQLNGAIQEYHYIEHRGVRTFPWRNPIVHHDSWAAGDEGADPYLEQHLVNDDLRFAPLFVTGDKEWRDYRVEVSVRPLSLQKEAGLAFRYRTSRHYYRLALEDGKRLRLAIRLPIDEQFRVSAWRELAVAPFPYDTKTYYRLAAVAEGDRLRGFVDGKPLIDVRDGELTAGIAGITANMPARFKAFTVAATPAAVADLRQRTEARERELEQLRAENPRPRLWRQFETTGFGTGRNVRFGDLDGDGRLDMLFAQQVAKVRGDAFDQISCLTAVTLDGKVLWQQGRPNPKNDLLTNDTPFQIHDLDGDGQAEVVLARDFQLQVLEGRTGRLLRREWLPQMSPELKDRPYELNIGDSLLFADLSGSGVPREILLKDRYGTFWIFDKDLKRVFEGRGQTGHYPFAIDTNGDGRQEFMIGYSLWERDGRQRWTHDTALKDHADALSIGSYGPGTGGAMRAYVDGSDEGLLIFDLNGTLLKQLRLGHAQTQSVGRYRPDLDGLQIAIANFWRNPGIVTILDHDGTILAQDEMIPGSSHLEPVNWRGDGQEFALLSGNVREGGMVDGKLRRVVMFPDDGHPDLASAVRDVTGDRRDEIVLWDHSRVWIYTQDRPFTGSRIYAPARNPHYNDSNYRASVSRPGWAQTDSVPPVAGFPVGWCIRARSEVFADAKRAGFEYVELALQDVLGLSDQEFEQRVADLRQLDLRALSGYNPVPADLKLVGPEIDRAKQDAHVALVVRRAARLGLSFLVFNSGASWRMPDGFTRAEAQTQLVDFARRLAAAAADHNITVLVSPLRSTDSNVMTTIAETVAFVKAVDRSNVAMMVDYSFLRIQKDDPAGLVAAGPMLRHVHVANPGVTPRAYAMDEKESDYAQFFAVLKQIGYRGGLSVHAGTTSFDTEAPRAIAFLRRRARELAQP